MPRQRARLVVTQGQILLVDFGASRVKAAVWDCATGKILHFRDASAPSPCYGSAGEVEIPADAHPALLRLLAEELTSELGRSFDACLFCSEMHGFLLTDEAGQPLTPYISWRDERAARSPAQDDISTLARLRVELGERFHQITGMALKSGLPFVTLTHMARSGILPRNARLLSLPEWVVTACGGGSGAVHETMAAASGFYDVGTRSWSEPLLSELGAGLLRNRVISDLAEPIGWLECGGKRIPVHGGVGDLQAAVLGAGTPLSGALCVNLGTGSQVCAIDVVPSRQVELRPYFDGRILSVLSHIPSGRAFRVFERLFDDIALLSAGQTGSLWTLLSALKPEEVQAAPLVVDLNVFAGAWRFRDGGSVAGIREGAMTARALAASLVRAYVDQYADAIGLIDPDRVCPHIILAGGMPRRIGSLAALLATRTGRSVSGPAATEEEALAGLALLASRLETVR